MKTKRSATWTLFALALALAAGAWTSAAADTQARSAAQGNAPTDRDASSFLADQQTHAFIAELVLGELNDLARAQLSGEDVNVAPSVNDVMPEPAWVYELLFVFYSQRGGEPVFATASGLTSQGGTLIRRLRESGTHGLPSDKYLGPEVRELLGLLKHPFHRLPDALAADVATVPARAFRDQLFWDLQTSLPTLPATSWTRRMPESGLPTERLLRQLEDSSWPEVVDRQRAAAEQLEILLAEALILYAVDMRVGNTSLAPSEPAMAVADSYLEHIGYADNRTSDEALADLPVDFDYSAFDWERAPSDWQLDEADWLLAMAAGGLRFEEHLDGLEPENDEYTRMRDALQRYREIAAAGGWKPMNGLIGVQAGERRSAIPGLRARLSIEGYESSSGDVFDASLRDALASWKEHRGLAADSVLDLQTEAALNTTVEERVASISLALQGLRHAAAESSAEELHVRVNIPSFRAELWDEGERVADWRAVVGSSRGAGRNETPEFSARMTEIALNPNWYPPRRLARIGEEDENGQIVVPPGPRNPMGQVKFLFPNPDAIYMHDTNRPDLFGKQIRAFSSGCVRVDDAVGAAKAILSRVWDVPLAEASARVDERLRSGLRSRVYIPEPVPVHISYRTAWIADDGKVAFGPDIYARESAAAERIIRDVYRSFPELPAERARDRQRRAQQLTQAGR